MPVNNSFIDNVTGIGGGSLQNINAYLERPRLQTLLENAAKFPLIAVYAGSGYGKTRAVHSFLQKSDALVTWMQITESDNVAAHFWEKYAHMISLIWPESGARLMEIGIPETEDGFAKYNAVRKDTLSPQGKCFFVYDDFHLLHNPLILRTFEKILNGLPSNGTVIVISRTTPEINLTGMMLRERIFTIREDDLRFTEDEIAEYFSQLELPVTRQDIHDIYTDTCGWAFALNLIGRSLSKDAKYERCALEAMKDNIFKLIETEVIDSISETLLHFLLRISLIDHLAAGLIRMLADDEETIRDLDTLNAYIRYDYHLGAYMIHNLFLDYLRTRQNILSEEEKCDTYNKAGMWCEENKYQTDALTYYEKARNYDAIMRIIYSDNNQMTQDIAEIALEIFNRMPSDIAVRSQLFPAMRMKINLSLGRFGESAALAEKYIREWEGRPESPEKNRALAEIYGIRAVSEIVMSPNSDAYVFDTSFEKQREYYEKCPYEATDPTIKESAGAYALLIGTPRADAPEEYIEALSRAIAHSSEVYRNSLFGLDDLSRGELLFAQREFNGAEQYLRQALDKSRSTGQYSIQNRALICLMQIAFSRGDIGAANDFLKKTEALLDVREYASRYDSYDIARSSYHLALGQPEKIPEWLKVDFSPYTHPAFLANYANRIKANYCFQMRQYSALLAFFANVRESNLLLLGKIQFKTLEALTLHHLKRRDEAVEALTEAYTLAEPNKIIVPFTQFAKDMRMLTSAALKSGNCVIPKTWLEDINRKSSAFARRQTHMISEIKAADDDSAQTVFTTRETNILKALSQGLSRAEIAESQKISVNTVKMVINSIYDKFGVTNLNDALRIAIARKIV